MSGRKRKSLWDSKESEIPPEFSKHDARHGQGNHSSHRPKWSELEANNSLKSNNRSQWSSSESWQDNDGRRDSNDIPETRRAVGVAYSYSRSPGFNGRGRQNHSPPSDVYWSQSSRYGRSRSSSRSKGRAGSRSRSRSRGRDRDMDKGRDVTRSWSRGRDRDLDKDRDTNWSRSSLYDHRREYNEMDDRKTESRVSSQICRDFAVGMCRRGDQCRFLHQDNLNPRDGGRPERERAERWSGRQETSEAFSADIERPRHHPIDKVSNYDRSNRSSSFDHDHRRHPHKNNNIPCRYFAMGRCHRDDCRFSHDHHGGGGEKERLQYDRYTLHTDDENKYRSGAKRGNANGVSDININEWSASDAGNTNYTDRTAKKHAYSRQDQDLKDENISWNGPKWSAELKDERASWNGPKWSDVTGGVSDVARTSQWVDGNAGNLNLPEPPISEMKTDERYGNSMDHMMQNRSQNVSDVANVDTFEPTGVTTFDRDAWVPAQGSNFQTVNGTPLQTYEKVIEGTSSQQLSNNLDHPLVSDTSYVQQNDMKRGNNDMPTDNFNAMNGVSISGNTIQLLVPDQSFNQNSGMLGSIQFHDTDQRNAIIVTPSKGHEIDLNRSDEQLFYQHQQEESKILCEESINNKQVFKSEVPQVDPGLLQNDMTSYQVATITDLSASLNEILSNGKQLPELYTALNAKNSNHRLASLSCSASVNSPVALTVGQPNPTTLFQEKQVPIGDIIEPCKHDQSDKPYDDRKPNITEDANNNKPYELGESKPLDQFILSSTVGPDSSKPQKICSPVKEPKGSPELKKLNLDMNLEAPENLTMKDKKRPEEEIPPSNANPEGGVREGNCGKDEKEMRLFKVALVEFVKEILKPTWKEGQMSREVHKSIVKKVVDKVTSTIQGAHVPKTQEKVDQYLACSKPKLTKLVQAYKERLSKT